MVVGLYTLTLALTLALALALALSHTLGIPIHRHRHGLQTACSAQLERSTRLLARASVLTARQASYHRQIGPHVAIAMQV